MSARSFYVIYGNNVMTPQMLEVSLLVAETVLRLERDAWSMPKPLRQEMNEYAALLPLRSASEDFFGVRIDRTLAGLSSRFRPQTVVVKLSQPFVCQLFLLGCILLNLTTAFHLGVPSHAACLGRPWILHVALTFTSRCIPLCRQTQGLFFY